MRKRSTTGGRSLGLEFRERDARDVARRAGKSFTHRDRATVKSGGLTTTDDGSLASRAVITEVLPK